MTSHDYDDRLKSHQATDIVANLTQPSKCSEVHGLIITT